VIPTNLLNVSAARVKTHAVSCLFSMQAAEARQLPGVIQAAAVAAVGIATAAIINFKSTIIFVFQLFNFSYGDVTSGTT
jgi:hypothetical protein